MRETTNGAGAAAVLAAGIGSFAVGLLAVIAGVSPKTKVLLIFYRPTGPLSGVTTVAIGVWLLSWAGLHYAWRGKNVGVGRICVCAFVLLGLALLLTFPPVAEMF